MILQGKHGSNIVNTRHFGINTTTGAESENHRRHYTPQEGTI
jgi:hypothetical protein